MDTSVHSIFLRYACILSHLFYFHVLQFCINKFFPFFFQCPYPLYRPPLKEGKRNLLFLFSYIFQSLRSPYFIKSLVFFNETLRWTRHGLDIHLRERNGGMGEGEGFQWERGRGEIGRRGGEKEEDESFIYQYHVRVSRRCWYHLLTQREIVPFGIEVSNLRKKNVGSETTVAGYLHALKSLVSRGHEFKIPILLNFIYSNLFL